MEINLFVFAIPFFLLFMGIEYFISERRKKPVYRINDFVNNLSCGLLEQVFCLPFAGFLLYGYNTFYHTYGLVSFNPSSPYTWILLWLGVDFCYYWFHRASHRCNFLWVGHSVHHQSEQYNLSVALRQGIIQTLCSWVIYLPLAFLGFPTWMFLIISSLNTLYQFWIHTKLIKRMGWFEVIFNTPSHHRAHHGTNPQYIDKNYGGSLIIWDKLFGTFEKEEEEVIYGTIEPLNSWNPFFANVKVMADIVYYGKYLRSWKQWVLLFIMPPEWIIKALGISLFKGLEKKKTSSSTEKTYPISFLFINLVFSIMGYSYLLLQFRPNSLSSWILIFFIFITLYMLGKILNSPTDSNLRRVFLLQILALLVIMHLFFKHYLVDGIVIILFSAFIYFLYEERIKSQKLIILQEK